MLIELVDTSGQPVWINPDYVVRVDWASAETTTLTLGVVQEFNAKVRPMTLSIHLPARQVVAILRGEAALPPPAAKPPAKPA